MAYEDNLISAQEMIMTAFTNIERAEVEKNNKLLKTWRVTLESIRSNAKNGENLGANLYAHSRVIDLKNGILLVEADHPAWIQTLRIYQKYILIGLKRGVPDIKISSLAFRLRGSNAELHEKINEEKTREDLKQRLEREDEALRKYDENNRQKNAESAVNSSDSGKTVERKEMPENLRKILERLKEDMLTNGE